MKILVAQTLYLGDLILTLPLVQHLRHGFPDADLDVLVARGLEDVVRTHPAVSSVLSYDKKGADAGWMGAYRLSRRLKAEGYTHAFVPPGSIRTALSVFLAGIPRRVGTNQSSGMTLLLDDVKFPRESFPDIPGRMVLYAEQVWRGLGGRHSFVSSLFTDIVTLKKEKNAMHRHLQLLEAVGLTPEATLSRPRLYPGAGERATVDRLCGPVAGATLIGLAPGSRWPTKRWPERSFASCINALIGRGLAVVLIGGEGDAPLCSGLRNQIRSDRLLNAAGILSPLESAELLHRCAVLLTNDSAPMHIAVAVGTPCVALFGPTVPAFGFAPDGERDSVLENSGLWCRPCTPHGGPQCPVGTHECMTSISVEMVTEKILETVRLEPPPPSPL